MISYIAGLPRSGSTVLASVLNQNPDIFVSSSSPLANVLYETELLLNRQISLRANPNLNAQERILCSLIPEFYSDKKQKLILDKAFTWGTPINYGLLRKYAPDYPRFLVMNRSINDVLISLIRLCLANPNNVLLNEFDGELSIERCKSFLLRENGIIENCIMSRNFLLETVPEDCLEIKYERLSVEPLEVIREIYNFFELPIFHHVFTGIINTCTDNDDVWGIKDFHTIKTTLGAVNE